MTSKQIKLIERCENIEPLDGRVIILPNKVKTRKEKQLSGKPKDPDVKPRLDEDGIGRYDADVEMVMEEVMVDINLRYQTAVVIKAADDETRFKAGDTIIYQIGSTFDFDYIKGLSLIRKYDVVAVVKA